MFKIIELLKSLLVVLALLIGCFFMIVFIVLAYNYYHAIKNNKLSFTDVQICQSEQTYESKDRVFEDQKSNITYSKGLIKMHYLYNSELIARSQEAEQAYIKYNKKKIDAFIEDLNKREGELSDKNLYKYIEQTIIGASTNKLTRDDIAKKLFPLELAGNSNFLLDSSQENSFYDAHLRYSYHLIERINRENKANKEDNTIAIYRDWDKQYNPTLESDAIFFLENRIFKTNDLYFIKKVNLINNLPNGSTRLKDACQYLQLSLDLFKNLFDGELELKIKDLFLKYHSDKHLNNNNKDIFNIITMSLKLFSEKISILKTKGTRATNGKKNINIFFSIPLSEINERNALFPYSYFQSKMLRGFYFNFEKFYDPTQIPRYTKYNFLRPLTSDEVISEMHYRIDSIMKIYNLEEEIKSKYQILFNEIINNLDNPDSNKLNKLIKSFEHNNASFIDIKVKEIIHSINELIKRTEIFIEDVEILYHSIMYFAKIAENNKIFSEEYNVNFNFNSKSVVFQEGSKEVESLIFLSKLNIKQLNNLKTQIDPAYDECQRYISMKYLKTWSNWIKKKPELKIKALNGEDYWTEEIDHSFLLPRYKKFLYELNCEIYHSSKEQLNINRLIIKEKILKFQKIKYASLPCNSFAHDIYEVLVNIIDLAVEQYKIIFAHDIALEWLFKLLPRYRSYLYEEKYYICNWHNVLTKVNTSRSRKLNRINAASKMINDTPSALILLRHDSIDATEEKKEELEKVLKQYFPDEVDTFYQKHEPDLDYITGGGDGRTKEYVSNLNDIKDNGETRIRKITANKDRKIERSRRLWELSITKKDSAGARLLQRYNSTDATSKDDDEIKAIIKNHFPGTNINLLIKKDDDLTLEEINSIPRDIKLIEARMQFDLAQLPDVFDISI